jgi:hypothetical protein
MWKEITISSNVWENNIYPKEHWDSRVNIQPKYALERPKINIEMS